MFPVGRHVPLHRLGFEHQVARGEQLERNASAVQPGNRSRPCCRFLAQHHPGHPQRRRLRPGGRRQQQEKGPMAAVRAERSAFAPRSPPSQSIRLSKYPLRMWSEAKRIICPSKKKAEPQSDQLIAPIARPAPNPMPMNIAGATIRPSSLDIVAGMTPRIAPAASPIIPARTTRRLPLALESGARRGRSATRVPPIIE